MRGFITMLNKCVRKVNHQVCVVYILCTSLQIMAELDEISVHQAALGSMNLHVNLY